MAGAQTAPDSQQSKAKDDLAEIVVTGTLIRGEAPAGANMIEMTQEAVQATGATTASQLLENIPQMGSFNSLQTPQGGFNQITTNRPNLRNLPGFLTSGSASTLVLLDGMRVVGMGVSTTTPDPDIVPPTMIERIEIVPDGGSAIYGSDAVAGVVNFITRKDFDGVEINGHYGRGLDYGTADLNATVGHSWSTGSAYLSYSFARHDALYGYNRDYVFMPTQTVAGIPFPVKSLKCSPGNVQLLPSGTVYALPYTTGTAVPNTANQCDESDPASIYPWEHRNSVFAGVTQKLGDSVKVGVTGFFMDRQQHAVLANNVAEEFIGPAAFGLIPSPFMAAHSITGSPFEVQGVSFQWGPPGAERSNIHLETWGIAPTLTADLGAGWQLRALVSFGESRTTSDTLSQNATVLAYAIALGLFNPYDPASSDPRGLSAVGNWDDVGNTRQHLIDTRVVVDGKLFSLPGGEVKLAAGLEYNKEKFESQQGNVVTGTQNTGYSGLTIFGVPIIPPYGPLAVTDLDRNVKAAFAEVAIPIFGKSNGFTGMEALNLNVSGRYDDYSDFGSTFNPKFGLTYSPIDWVKLRGNWGRSFVAPSLADFPQSTATSFNWVPGLSFLYPPANLVASGKYPAPVPGQLVGVVLGNAPNTQPQKAQTWSVGFDLAPPVAEGLDIGLTYWNIKYNDVIALPPFIDQVTFWNNFGKYIYTNPTQAQINAFTSISTVTQGAPCAPQPQCLYAILDARKTNLGDYNVDGLDFQPTYHLPTSFGSLNFAINATYALHREQSPIAGAPFVDVLANNQSRWSARFTAGSQIHRLYAEANINHTAGYSLDPPVGIAPQLQTHVASYDVVNLFFKYDVPGFGMLKNLEFTLNVNNAFDRRPPAFYEQNIVASNDGYANGLTLGRVFILGADARF
jgi:iron complex outermembrane recepter protein